jgi:hypothetical protein
MRKPSVEIRFEMDDQTTDIEFEGVDNESLLYNENTLTSIMNKIRECGWFVEGNRTEGIIQFQHIDRLEMEWTSININEELETEYEDHSAKVKINFEDDEYKYIQL